MQIIPTTTIDGIIQPETPIPLDAVATVFDGKQYLVYFEGDELPAPIENLDPPDWQGFMNALDLPERGGNGLFNVLVAIDFSVANAALMLCCEGLRSGLQEQDCSTLTWYYSLLRPGLSNEQYAELQRSIARHNIPVALTH